MNRSQRAFRRLQRLEDVALNFQPPEGGRFSAEDGWLLDHHRQPLLPERPGDAEAGGSFERAREAMRHYEFADPRLIEAIYHPDRELLGRTMLLIGKFGPLRFHMGARVSDVYDERTVCPDGRDVQVWGWGYQTLEGHLETGRMRFRVYKWIDDGSVAFHIDAASKPARIANLLTRIGFRVFGRRLQLSFARRACERMDRIVAGKPVRRRRA